MTVGPTEDRRRCSWAAGPWLTPYHDQEWGVPVHDDRRHYEFLVLEAAQAGLSWLTILKRRANYRRAFCDFDFDQVARFGDDEIDALVADAGIIRNRAKIEAAVTNARALRALRDELGSLDAFLWERVDGRPLPNAWSDASQVPARTALSEQLSRDLRRRGFRFVGPIVCYAHLQATGLVNDHLVTCFRWGELQG